MSYSNLIGQPYPIILNPHGGGGSAKPAANAEYHVGEIGKDPVQYPRTDIAYKDEETGEEMLITSPIYTNNSGAFVASKNSGTIIQPYMKNGLGHSVLIKGRRGTIYESKSVGDPGNISNIAMISYKATETKSAVEVMISQNPLINIGDKCTTGGTSWEKIASNGDIKDFKALTPVLVDDYGAKGDALLSRNLPLYLLITEGGNVTNPDATDDTQAIKEALENHSDVVFSGERGYLVSQCFPSQKSNQRIDGRGAAIIYRGGKTPSTETTGIFQFPGVYDSLDIQATPKSGVSTFQDYIDVQKVGNKLKKGSFCILKARNDASDFSKEVVTAVFANAKVRDVQEIDGNTQRLFFDYKFGFSFTQAQITIGKSEPVCDGFIGNFQLIDEMPATPSPDSTTEAPDSEKKEAVGLVRLGCVSNFKVENLVGYKGKYSLFDCQIGNNVATDNIKSYNPVWFGPGEGYGERWGSSIYGKSNNLHLTGGRHVIDYTKCGWMHVSNASGGTNQVSFSCHTNSEHDITFENCTGGSFYLSNQSFGNSCARITLDKCNFDKVLINCLHMTIKNSQLNDFIGTVSKLTTQNSNIKNFKSLTKETRAYSGDIVNEYAENGKIVIDEKSSIKRAKDYSAGTGINGFFVADIKGRISSESGDTRPEMKFLSNPSLSITGEVRNTKLLIGGRALSIEVMGANIKNTDAGLDGSAISINSIDIENDEIQKWRIFENEFELNGNQRPFQIVSRGDSARPYKAVISGGGNVMINTQQAQIDGNGANLDIVGLSYTRDAYSDGSDTYLRAADNVLYKANETAANKGSSGGPAIRNADNTAWVDLT